jgi:hypothetical protein
MQNKIHSLTWLALLTVILAAQAPASDKPAPPAAPAAAAPRTFAVKDLLKSPDGYWNQTVVIEGLVTQVCRRSGKKAWLHDTDPEAAGQVRVERTGNAAVFGREFEGKTIRVTGVLRELRIDTAYLDSWEARVKGAKAAAPKADACTEGCEESQSVQAGLKRVQALREQLAKSKKDHLSSLWVDAEKWEVTQTSATK